ncbi:hypothetical protein C5B91_17480 [Haloferax sp. Atlit-10N]|nr:hypothetical protein C5B86_18110 [Haloferax sp. Atlit-19N]RDZ39893.1 hypothetical protein C5B87_18485 [Haloferax sp. Atlit-16N]RDZ56581.1 hypothetical protein C5B91_17480 [Haloferax sp. Atlit-10N]REA02779.1 hypothetical protein DEQ92_13435 [Haloferax sp. Atlit-6N]
MFRRENPHKVGERTFLCTSATVSVEGYPLTVNREPKSRDTMRFSRLREPRRFEDRMPLDDRLAARSRISFA